MLLKASFLGESVGACRSWCAGADGGRARASGERRGGVLLRRSSDDKFWNKKHYSLQKRSLWTRTGIADVIPENIDFKQKKTERTLDMEKRHKLW